MKKEITTKDLMALNELMTFENWIAVKLKACSETCASGQKNMFLEFADLHAENHKKLLKYLEKNV